MFSRQTDHYLLLRPWQTRTYCCGHIVADTSVSPFARTRNICCGHTNFVSGTQKCFWLVQTFCVRNKCFPVCAAQETSWATMCPQQCVVVCQGLYEELPVPHCSHYTLWVVSFLVGRLVRVVALYESLRFNFACFTLNRTIRMLGPLSAIFTWPSKNGAQDRRNSSAFWSSLPQLTMRTLYSLLGTCGFRRYTRQHEIRQRKNGIKIELWHCTNKYWDTIRETCMQPMALVS